MYHAFEVQSQNNKSKILTFQSLVNFIQMQYKICLQTQSDFNRSNQPIEPRKHSISNIPSSHISLLPPTSVYVQI